MRSLTAAELLAIRREIMAMETDDEAERCMMGNAMVIAACCEREGERVFADGQTVLHRLTAAEMERLIETLRQEERAAAETWQQREGTVNGSFDEERFRRLREREEWIM